MLKNLIIICLLLSNGLAIYSYLEVHRSLDMMIDWDNISMLDYPQGIMTEGSHYCVILDGNDEYTEHHEICHEMVARDREHFCYGED